MFTVRNPLSFFRSEQRDTLSQPALTMNQWAEYFIANNMIYPLLQYSQPSQPQEEIGQHFSGVVRGAYKSSAVVFACMRVRMSVFSEMRFRWRRLPSQTGRPGPLFGTPDLAPLETPWPGATTRTLAKRAIQDADLAGNFFAAKQPSGDIVRLRPDWMTIVIGSFRNPETIADDPDAQVVGYLYHPGGRGSGREPTVLSAQQVAHWAPYPDPESHFRGMSWLTPVIREIMGDKAATEHKLRFFEYGATINHAIKLSPEIRDEETFNLWTEKIREQTEGLDNAYKTLILAGGADIVPVGTDMQQLDFKATQGAGETRIAAAAGVHPSIVGLSEGLQGASLNAGNFGAAKRLVSDGTIRELWGDFCGVMAKLVIVPAGAELWYDDRDVAFLQDDMKDKAQIQQMQATAMNTLYMAGYDPDSIVAAVDADDWTLLKHTGAPSVQTQGNGQQQLASARQRLRALSE